MNSLTPTRRSIRLPAAAFASVLACGAAAFPARAADTPAAAEPGHASESFRLRGIALTGVSELPDVDLGGLIASSINRMVTFDELQAIADGITAIYHDNGYFLARATVPVQQVRDGVVEISVSEGRLGKLALSVAADAPISEARVRGMLAGLKPGTALNLGTYERAILLLSDLPGVRAQSALEEGAVSGTTDLTVTVTAKKRWLLAADADDNGTRASGRERFGLTARWLSPAGIGDNLDARFLISSNASIAVGRLAYEAPVNNDGWRAGVGFARVNYELGGQFAALDAQGYANVADVSLSYPLLRSRNENVFLRFTADYKDLTDELRAVNQKAQKRVVGGSASLQLENRDDFLGGGFLSYSMSAYIGNLNIRDDVSRYLDQSAFGHHTNGNFYKANLQLSRLQSLFDRTTLFVSVGGQYAGDTLDASEKLNVGGAGTVRAYPNGELLADDALVTSAEVRYSVLQDVSVYPFYDFGRGRIFHHQTPFDTGSFRTISGYGLGFTWARPGNFTISSSVAWRDDGEQLSEGSRHEPRWLWQIQKIF